MVLNKKQQEAVNSIKKRLTETLSSLNSNKRYTENAETLLVFINMLIADLEKNKKDLE